MPTVYEMENSMTVYFSRSTGEIRAVLSGVQDMNIYGEETEDFSQIRDCKVYQLNKYVIRNFREYKVDLETYQLLKKEVEAPVIVDPVDVVSP